MKIGIVTLPFNSNYGGLLQAFALQSSLRNMGHEPTTVYRRNPIMPLHIQIISSANRLAKSILNHKMGVIRSWATAEEELIIDQHTNRFISENISTTEMLKSERDFSGMNDKGFEAWVVGSDQVWRPKYSPSLSNHFLGFVTDSFKAKRVSYAASFGVDQWEFSPDQTEKCRKLLLKFDAVSVREDSGVKLCGENLRVEAKQVLDPTLLLPKEEYIRLVEKDSIAACDGTLLTYVLDKAPDKIDFIRKVAEEKGLRVISIMPKSLFRDAGRKRIDDCIYPPVTAWLRGFMDAECVITDSYHGMVFAIIFNKPFLALGNSKRGMARFSSLLKLFGLEERMALSTEENLMGKLNAPIDFSKVNDILMVKRHESLAFLENSLKT